MKVLRSWRVKLLLCCALVLLALYGFKELYMDSLSDSVEQCRGNACKKPSLLHSNLQRNLFNLAPFNFSHLPTVRSAKSANSPHRLVPTAKSHPPAAETLPPPSISPAKHVVQKPQVHPMNFSTSVVSYPSPPSLPPQYHRLTLQQANTVRRFVFFIGYGRSGHSIVGSIMDAHPNVIIAHEFYLFDKLSPYIMRKNMQDTKLNLFDQLYYSSYESASTGWRSSKKTGKGYNLNLKGTWQGQFDRLEVIGDKTGGATAMLYHDHPEIFKYRLKLLDMITRLPHAAIHVVRNPYDMIATVAMFQASTDVNNVKITASVQDKFKERQFVRMAADIVLDKAEAVAAMIQDCKLDVLEVHLETLIADPHTVIRRICSFLKIPCAEDYIRVCSQKLYRKASYSRDLVEWPLSVRTKVDQAIQNFTFFRQYSFEER